ncbi:acyl-CoA synthetase (AMP-forming)/AMP-acid ligase II [Lachnotalea glycerini]|uniref:Acyl-CoA synthetase (AMP-forming)/AMP-acid ligase II n=1 Tax=Lachnotalea glycerini TaxID=1763509 RepID=A0A318ETU8_9FIRM|nr:AMP-binding protein [Lachnotalea glycerini]PXV87787.1 acyl-CoA synthetase (AMP-forming)/AMP-acid ligase II [Lachnotalea glycerini]
MQLFEMEKSYSDRVLALDEKNRVVTYQELDSFAEEFYQNIGKKSLVFILCSNTIGSLLGYLSCLKTGVVPLMLASHIHEKLLTRLLNEYQPDFLYVPVSCLDKVSESEIVWKTWGYCLCRRKVKQSIPLYEELSLLLTTSGSTGSPKLVRQSGDNIDANAASICKYLNIDKNERPVTTLPMNYTYGLSIINSHVLKGATILLTNQGMVERDFWNFVKEKKATSFGGVPYTYQILKRIGFMDMDLPKLKTMTQAGGKLSLNLHREFALYAARTGKEFIVMYGQTEATARMGYLPSFKAVKQCGSIGIAIPGGRFWLKDEEGKEILKADTEGELVYEGKNVALGYAGCAKDLKKQDNWKGILYTGDIAKRDMSGYYYITGRKKRFIKLFGNRINLDEVERMLKDSFEEVDFACIGVDDQLIIYTDITKENGKELILDYLFQMTGINARSVIVRYLNQIPKNEAGKTLYGELDSKSNL